MGMSAAQAKLLSLTARRSDINFQLSSLMRGKLDLMTQASNAADALNAAKNNNNIFVMTTSDNQQTQLSFNNLAKEGLTIVDSRGRTIVPASYKSNPTGLTSILPNNHPAISSYDGDFVVKNKLNKNYISLANTINIFDNDKDNVPSKKIKAASGEPTKVDKYSWSTAIVSEMFNSTQYGSTTTYGKDNNQILTDLKNTCTSSNLITVFARNGKVINEDNLKDHTDEIQTLDNEDIGILSLDSSDYTKNIGKKLFRTEIYGYDKNDNGISDLNKKFGAEYEAYNKRTFQDKVSWSTSLTAVSTHADKTDAEVTYVSNAQQLITALLKGANINKLDRIESDANIMLLNDIDLDDMLQDSDGKNGLKDFIIDEIKKINGCTSFDGTNFNDISCHLTSSKETSDSHIKGDVLKHIWNKYFSSEDGTDNFNEDFTNFIQIDKFTGSIGGGGFAINNLKMSTKNNQFAGMFNYLDNAVIHGVWMDNANVFAQRKKDGDTKLARAAILANTVTGNSTTLVTARGMQMTYNSNDNHLKPSTNTNPMAHDSYDKYQYFGIVANDNRSIAQMVGGTVFTDHWTARKTSGWSFLSTLYTKNNNDTVKDFGWRTFSQSGDGKHGLYQATGNAANAGNISNYGGVNIVHQNSTAEPGQKVKYGSNLYDDPNVLALILSNSNNENSKIKFFTKEEVDEYKKPDGEDWKVGAKFDDGTEVNWDDWYIAPGSFNSETGEYTLTATHGEETAEYVALKENLEFYKSQGVIVEENENRDEGQFTYSARGYSVDLEYKDDLTKYNADNYLYKVENNDSSVIIYEREKVNEVDMSQLVFVDDIEALLDKNIKNGVWFVQGASVSDATKYERKTLDEIGISETTDENADAIAQAEYERKMRDIELQEEKFDAQITELESTLKGIEQEIENQEKIVKQNVQSSFSTFAS